MSAKIKDFFMFLKQKLGTEMPEDVSQEADIKSQCGPWDFILAAREIPPEKDWLLGEVKTLLWDVAHKEKEAVFPLTEPGFSNKRGAAHEAKVPLIRKRFVAATIIDAQAQDKEHRSLLCGNAILALANCCEDQLINGDGSELTGLLNVSGTPSITNDKRESRENFCRSAIKEYKSAVGHRPTLVVLSNIDRFKLHAEKGVEHAAQETPKEVGGVELMALDIVPEGRGLLLTVDDIVLASSPVEWKFGCKDAELSTKGQSQIIVSFGMGLALKNPKAVAQLILEGKQD